MKLILKNKLQAIVLLAAFSLLMAGQCNKEFNEFPPPAAPPAFNVATSLDSIIKADAGLTYLKAAIARAGFNALLADGNSRYTIFAPTDAAFAAWLTAQMLPASPATFAALPVANVQDLLRYHVIPQVFTAAQIPTNAPNLIMPSLIQLAPTLSPAVRMGVFASKRGANAWANNVPIVQTDVLAGNGVIHKIALPLNPVSTTLKARYSTDANLTYLAAAIARADSGQVNLGRLDSVANFALANITIHAPSNAAFVTLLTGAITQALIAQGVAPATAAAQAAALASTPAVFSNPALFPVLTATRVRGIVAYHILSSGRYYGANYEGVTSVQTAGGAALPNVTVDFNSGAVRFLGAGNGGLFANVTAANDHRINGVIHVIDRVLLPQ
jgi:uncharacterized surface protein with fasciclin (FAS1) repeats